MRLKRAGDGGASGAPQPARAPLLASTRGRILAAAERLFAERGVAATSLRAITRLARVNLAAVNYHFGSREALVEAVYERRLGPLNRARLRQLDDAEHRASPPAVAAVVAAFVEPIVDLSARDARDGPLFVRLLAQTHAEAGPCFHKLFARENAGVVERFSAALARALPQLTPTELALRLQFMVGAVNHAVADTAHPRLGNGAAPDLERAARELVPFIVAGLQARRAHEPPARH